MDDAYKAAVDAINYPRLVMFQCDASLLELAQKQTYHYIEMKSADKEAMSWENTPS